MKLFQYLARKGRDLQGLRDHREGTLRTVIQLRPSGELLSQTTYAAKEAPTAPVPQAPPGANLLFATAVANWAYTMGTVVQGEPDDRTREKHRLFLQLLASLDGPEVQAIRTYLSSAELPRPPKGLESTLVVFSVLGHNPRWWLKPSVVARHHARMTSQQAEKGQDVRGTCACCGEPDQPIARVWPQSPVYGVLASRNDETLEGHGWTGARGQSYGIFYCTACAEAVVNGYTALCQANGHYHRTPDIRMLWWTPDAQVDLWGLLTQALSPSLSMDVRTAAMKSLQEAGPTVFALLQKNMSRVAIRAWGEADGAQVASRVAAFVHRLPMARVDPTLVLPEQKKRPKKGKKTAETSDDPDAYLGWILPYALCPRGEDRAKGAPEMTRWAERLLARIILGTPLPERDIRQIQKECDQDSGGLDLAPSWQTRHRTLFRHRRDFLTWVYESRGDTVPRSLLLPKLSEESADSDSIPSYFDSYPPGLRPGEGQFAEYIGRAFARACQAQRRKSPRIQRGIEDQLVPGAQGDPQHLVRLVHKHGVYALDGGGQQLTPLIKRMLARAHENAPGLTRLRPPAAALLLNAYWREYGRIQAEVRARRASSTVDSPEENSE